MSLNLLTVGEGRALLLLHGFTGTARSWEPHLERWAASHRVIAPDLLGHGHSDAPVDPSRYALERQASDLAGLLALLEVTSADVVGYSMGARLALALALEHSHLVQQLVLESPSAGIADPAARAERRMADEQLAVDIERDGVEAFVDQWERLPLFASHAALPVATRERLRAERVSHDPVGLASSLRGAGQGAMAPLHDRLPEITRPTLVVAGALDEIGTGRARVVAESLSNARLEVIVDAGHTPHLERPDVFAASVDEFLSLAPASPAH